VAFGVFVQMLTPLRIEHYTNIFQEAAVTGYEVHPLAIVAQGLKFGVFINLALAIFNLAPLPPLDGSNLLESLLPPSFGPLFGTVRSLGCLLLPFTLGAAFLMMLFVFLPAAWLLFHFLGAFLVRM
jgi:Zn-dependent protease